VGAVSRTGLEAETLRQSAVGKILGLPESAARTRLLGAQTRQIEGDPALKIRLEAIKKLKSPDEIDKLRAETFQATQAGELSEQRSIEINKLLNDKIEAGRLGNVELQKQIDERLTVLFPNTKGGQDKAQVRARDVLDEMTKRLVAGKTDTLPREKFITQQEQTAVEIEQDILDKPKGDKALSRYQDYNRYSNRSKVAINDDGKIKFVPISRTGGKQRTAAEVNTLVSRLGFTMEEAVRNAQAADMDLMEYLQAVVQNIERRRGQ
jgi:hypothetical protein